jgi:diaminopimelate epimerase
MHGIGNDFIVVNRFDEALEDDALPEISRRVCHRKFGIGGDGLVLVQPSKVADYKMRMLNPDGSEAEMCGNGIRCFAKYLYDRKMITESSVKVETLAGIKTLKLVTRGGKVEAVRVDMGTPRLRRSEIPMRGDDTEKVVKETLKIEGQKFEFTAVSMGNPHVIIFVDDVARVPISKLGPAIENHSLFPERTNVHFVSVCSNSEVVARTWERGAGETLACGTGACSIAVACQLNGKTGRTVLVHLPGGDLKIEWLGDNRVIMTGPTEDVFEGEIAL